MSHNRQRPARRHQTDTGRPRMLLNAQRRRSDTPCRCGLGRRREGAMTAKFRRCWPALAAGMAAAMLMACSSNGAKPAAPATTQSSATQAAAVSATRQDTAPAAPTVGAGATASAAASAAAAAGTVTSARTAAAAGTASGAAGQPDAALQQKLESAALKTSDLPAGFVQATGLSAPAPAAGHTAEFVAIFSRPPQGQSTAESLLLSMVGFP